MRLEQSSIYVECTGIVNTVCRVSCEEWAGSAVHMCAREYDMFIAPTWDKGRAASGSPAGTVACVQVEHSTKVFSKQQGVLQVAAY